MWSRANREFQHVECYQVGKHFETMRVFRKPGSSLKKHPAVIQTHARKMGGRAGDCLSNRKKTQIQTVKEAG